MAHHAEDTTGKSKSEATTDPEHAYYQGIQHTLQDDDRSRVEVRRAFQALQEHHYQVQELYNKLAHAMQTGQDREQIWLAYHEALHQHRHLLHHYLRQVEEHHRRRGYR
jgi:hypothetical protein